jgi:hypothetical protein
MALMPRGEPRTVPDPDGERYDEMLRQEWERRRRAEAAATKPQVLSDTDLKAALFTPVERRFDFDDRRQLRTGRIGNQTYKEIDNGRANVLVPIDEASPAELAERQKAVERVVFMTEHPFAGAAYGLATVANASPEARDRAMVAGGLADTAMLGAAPRTTRTRSEVSPQGKLGSPAVQRPSIIYWGPNAEGLPTGSASWVTKSLLGTGQKGRPRFDPPGWGGNGIKHNEARAHLHGRSLGGSRGRPNIVTLTQNGANTPQMSGFERKVANKARAGEVVEYSVTPLYKGGRRQPHTILLNALGSRDTLPSIRFIPNAAWHRE